MPELAGSYERPLLYEVNQVAGRSCWRSPGYRAVLTRAETARESNPGLKDQLEKDREEPCCVCLRKASSKGWLDSKYRCAIPTLVSAGDGSVPQARRSEPWINGLALQGQHSEDALMYLSQGFALYETL